jgi:cobalamin-dependent methionine synthase I
MSQKVMAIAESINIMGKRSGNAMKERVQGPIQEMAKEEAAAGASYLDLNIGPARKDGTELMPGLYRPLRPFLMSRSVSIPPIWMP